MAAIQLVLRRPIPTPAAQLRIIWQGHREGDNAQAHWTDSTGGHEWPGSDGVRWLQRDTLRQGEEWKVNLPGVPAAIDRVVLRLTSTAGRTVGVVVLPLTGSADDAVQHPGTELLPRETKDLLEFTRSGNGWLVTALSSAVFDVVDGGGDAEQRTTEAPGAAGNEQSAPPTTRQTPEVPVDSSIRGWSGPVTDRPFRSSPEPGTRRPIPPSNTEQVAPAASGSQRSADNGPQVRIPARLEQAVDAARATGNTRRRTSVGAVIDLSASMRPWITSGQLADVLTAVQAIAGASSRPSVTTRYLPADDEVDLELATEPAQALSSQLAANGLRTGSRSALLGAVARAGRRGGLTVLVTDDSSLAAGPGVTVVLGPPAAEDLPMTPGRQVISVPPGPVDIRRLTRQLADASAAS
ncbi:MAG: hypothetical protein ABJD68_00110 [Nakamurella sp.]